MKKKLYKLLAIALCLCLCINMGMTAFAVNSRGVTFSAVLDKSSITVSDTAQTIVMTVKASEPVTVDGIGFTTTWDAPLTISGITGGSQIGAYDAVATNIANGKGAWSSPDAENVANVTDLAVITFTVPANTPAGSYRLGVNELELTSDYGDIWEDAAIAQTTLTITAGAGSTQEAYQASLSSATSSVTVGDTVSVSVNVASESYTAFNAAELALTYSDNLTFVSESSTLNGASVNASTGSLTLVDKGESQTTGNSVYILRFTANSVGTATVALTSAAFGTNREAETRDLVGAACNTTPLTITIHKASHAVTLPAIFAGAASVENGASYTFGKETVTGAYYDYNAVTATMDGVPVAVIANEDGTWTIENVTGDLVISGTRTPKQYTVTINGNTAANDGTTAAYQTDYHFTLPENVPAGISAGYSYTLTSVTIGGNAYAGYTVNGRVVTIPGTDITGNLVITITETVLEANQYTVSVTGNGAGDAVLSATVVDKNGSVSLTLTPEEGYTYSVAAEGYTVSVDENVYTVADITSNVIFTVTKQINTAAVTVTEYVTLDGSVMWLIQNARTKLEGKVYTYSGQAMFWSEAYNAYCTLVIAAEKPAPTAGDFAIITGDGIEVDYGKDVNMTNKVDANDAQLVYNIYNADYSAFTADVTIEKLLRADINGDGMINVADASAIVASLLV